MALLCFVEYFEGCKIFLQEIRIFSFDKKNCKQKKKIHRGLFIIEPNSLVKSLEGNLVYMIYSSNLNKFSLINWNFKEDKEEFINLQVERPNNAKFYSFNRIIVPFCLSYTFTGETEQLEYVKGSSGISVYDFNSNSLWKINFDYDYLNHIVEMFDQNTLIFVNAKNQIEWWDLQENSLVKKIECLPNVFKSIKYAENLLFMTNANNEFIIWEAETLNCLLRRKIYSYTQKISVFDKNAVILNVNGTVEIFNLIKNKMSKVNVSFVVKDFVLQNYNLILIGEALFSIFNIDEE